MVKLCEVCGVLGNIYGKNGKFKMDLCTRHRQQMVKYGEIQENTMFDDNEVVINGDTAEVILRNNKNEEVGRAIIDTSSLKDIKGYRWGLNTTKGYVVSGSNKIHRLITKCPIDKIVDHINHNKLDNRISNLRICTKSENGMNRSVASNNKSGYTGVHWYVNGNRWSARITLDYKKIHLGYFVNIEDAIKARKDAETKYYGEFSYTG